ncbi:MAG: hypothetical protein RL557_783 [archaeon]|jgi:hypothetical protein
MTDETQAGGEDETQPGSPNDETNVGGESSTPGDELLTPLNDSLGNLGDGNLVDYGSDHTSETSEGMDFLDELETGLESETTSSGQSQPSSRSYFSRMGNGFRVVGRGTKYIGKPVWGATKGIYHWADENRLRATILGTILAGGLWIYSGFWPLGGNDKTVSQTSATTQNAPLDPSGKKSLEKSVTTDLEKELEVKGFTLPETLEKRLVYDGEVHDKRIKKYDLENSDIDMIRADSLEYALKVIASSRTTCDYFYDPSQRRVTRTIRSKRNRNFTTETMAFDITDNNETSQSILKKADANYSYFNSIINKNLNEEVTTPFSTYSSPSLDVPRGDAPPPIPPQEILPEFHGELLPPVSGKKLPLQKPYNQKKSSRSYEITWPRFSPDESLREIMEKPKNLRRPFNY